MGKLIRIEDAIDALEKEKSLVERPITETRWFDLGLGKAQDVLSELPSAESNIEKAFRLFVNWADECGFGYDNIHDLYEEYRDDIRAKGLSYIDGLMYIAKMEVERGAYVRED